MVTTGLSSAKLAQFAFAENQVSKCLESKYGSNVHEDFAVAAQLSYIGRYSGGKHNILLIIQRQNYRGLDCSIIEYLEIGPNESRAAKLKPGGEAVGACVLLRFDRENS
jgi:hypothetical protein